MKSKILVNEKAFIPYFKHYPFETVEQWGQALRDNIPTVLEALLKGVRDDETYRKKIVKLLIIAVRKMLGNGFIGLSGFPEKLRIEIAKAKLTGEDADKNFIDCVKLADEAFDQGELNSAMIAYYLGTSFGPNRFRDVIEKALGWLTPYIQPDKQGRFREKFHNQVERSGKLITGLAYDPEYIKQGNDIIYRLINEHLRKGIIPFSAGGASHCDFVLIKDSIILYDSAKSKEIRYETYKRFISEKHADKLKSIWRVIDESIPPNPDEYIGHPEKSAYFDMNLDIQVSEKD